MPEVLKQIIEEPKNQKEAEEQEQKPRQFPIGIGGTKLKEGRETLPAVEVANEVIWVNLEIEAPLDLKEGEATQLGRFLTPKPDIDDYKTNNMEIKKPHFRSSLLGHVLFKDREGRLYRDIDLKGMGYIKTNRQNPEPYDPYWNGGLPASLPPYFVAPVEPVRGLVGSTKGILNKEFAENDIDMAENFLKWGIRTHRAIGLVKLNEIIDPSGNKISVKKAKERGLLKYRDEPVIEIRAFGSRSRIDDVSYEYDKKKSRNILFNDAKVMVAQESGIDINKFSDRKYFNWMVKTMAQNVARMHSNGLVHGYLSDHNITLDGRIVDLDSVETLEEIAKNKKSKKSFIGDLKWIVDALINLYDKLFIGKIKRVSENEYRIDIASLNIVYSMIASRFISEYAKELKRLGQTNLFYTIVKQLTNQNVASMWFDRPIGIEMDQKKFFIDAFKKESKIKLVPT